MSVVQKQLEDSDIRHSVRRARRAAHVLAALSNERRNEALHAAADAIEARSAEILAANDKDCAVAQRAVESGDMTRALFARLRTTERGIAEMAMRVREVAQLPDPLHRRLSAMELDDNLVLYKESCPLGVVGVVFESRPDVVPQISSLALKSGNAVCLKGGAEAIETNTVLVGIWRDALSAFPDIPADSVVLFHTREDVAQILTLHEDIDLIVPRGSNEFVRWVTEHSRIPVLGHGEGICHVYVHSDADLQKAFDVALDSKVQYPAACNALETLLVHKDIAPRIFAANDRAIPRGRSRGARRPKNYGICRRKRSPSGDRGRLEKRIFRHDHLDQSGGRRQRSDRAHQPVRLAAHRIDRDRKP